MKIHELKTYPHYFEETIKGNKPFEIRLNDRGFQTGDIVILKEWDNIKYSGREIKGKITYILPNHFIGLAEGYIAFALEFEKDSGKHGKWIWDPNSYDWGIGAWVCSECRGRNANIAARESENPYAWVGTKFCPNCGVNMERQKQ